MNVRTILCCLIAIGLLSSCGGGGGTSGGPATTTLMIALLGDAHTDGVTVTIPGANHIVGDSAGNTAVRGLLSFSLTTVPAGANVVGAFLNISFLNRIGMPGGAGNLGDMQFHRISAAGPFATTDFAAASLAHDPANNLAIDFPNLRPRIGILALVLSALAAGDDLKIRLQYEMLTDGNGSGDVMEFASLVSATPAVLEVITQP